MTKYELVEKTEVNGEVWYYIKKDGKYLNDSYTRQLEDAEKMIKKLINSKPSEPIIKILKTIELDENETN
jgi:hypothetical protein